jgi:hypothetical protein
MGKRTMPDRSFKVIKVNKPAFYQFEGHARLKMAFSINIDIDGAVV